MAGPGLAMPTVPTRLVAPCRQCGFSLLELLVTLVVIVLLTSLVNFSFDSGSQQYRLESQVRNLADVAIYALDEAQVTGVDYGLLLQEELVAGETINSYRWLERHIDGWRDPRSGKELFAAQRLPPGIVVELEIEDAPPVDLSPDDGRARIIQPQLVFYASGETAPGAVNVRRADDGELLWRIEWDLLGRFDVLPRGQSPGGEY